MKGNIIVFVCAAMLTACVPSENNFDEQTIASVAKTMTESSEKTSADVAKDTKKESAPAASYTDGNAAKDINLRVSSNEIVIGQDDSEVIFYAEVPVSSNPEKVLLIDADTGETAAELFDEADYEKYSDTIKGDGVYNCRFTINTDIGTNEDVSEEKTYRYYASFTDDSGTHISDITEIDVMESFTDKELDDMEAVDNAIQDFLSTPEFKDADLDKKRDMAAAMLKDLAKNGTKDRPYILVKEDTIYPGDTTVSFEYICGVVGGVMIKGFDPYMN